jgi:hypothetical protein
MRYEKYRGTNNLGSNPEALVGRDERPKMINWRIDLSRVMFLKLKKKTRKGQEA